MNDPVPDRRKKRSCVTLVNAAILYLLKSQEKQFYFVFRGYKIGTLARN